MCEVHKDEKINKECCCSKRNHKEHNHKEHHHEHHHEHSCGCGHDHEHGGDIEGKEIAKIFLAGIFLVAAIFVGKYSYELSHKLAISLGTVETISLILYLISYFTVGGEVVKTAVRNIMKGKVFDENFLMALATVGAFFIGEYPEAVAVMMFYQVGEMFQDYAVGKSRKSISALMDIRPNVAYVKLHDGTVVKKEPSEVRIGEIIVVKPGEKVALDGKLAKGEGTIDTMALTGESLPREIYVGDDIISGSISVSGVLEIEVTKEFSQSTVSKILELVENASHKKADSEKFITKFARYYTPVVVVVALLLATIPPFIEGVGVVDVWYKWLYRALSFLVISCPCALVISVPLSFFAGIGGASANGILIKGSSYMEALAKTGVVVFDKTGTLTKGNFKVVNAIPYGDEKELNVIKYATIAELYSNHPIGLSLKETYKNRVLEHSDILETIEALELKTDGSNFEEITGYGIKAMAEGQIIYVGNHKLMDKVGISYEVCKELGTIVYVAIGESEDKLRYIGAIVIADEIKDDSKDAILGLKTVGVEKTVMLTGDKKNIAEYVGNSLGVTEIYSQLLPADKVDKLEMILAENKGEKKVAFAGDGINDAPVLARADIGIAMGGLGQDAAIEAADIVIMDDKPSSIVKAIKISKKTLSIVKQNIVFAIGVKVLVLFLAALGIASMWYAVFADVGVCVIAILNALRAMKYKFNK
ncbi:MAG: heavy metal translocating P-type ATPase [Lachnospiraceae bacterium]|nr:heavy metal translocating P-type ATPase [Lachnospiraceae bacterium]MBQ2982065.1 heavy metal translocating P-type ATPase [Lachnospiraceae bacterium]